ncbi:hypothetical protein [Microbacterium hominis]|uniref:Uncharacterized protein n=1 Tax=Microbacterium hominis TaxID=162426 RepID=A0A7D4Q6Y0_9MICO|nr:hypothetical protein [Microbacterium hominis]QKJ18579.1 hypothetical protein HQM25_03720 [Microbacterium hominis]
MVVVTNEIFDQWENDWRKRMVGCSLVAEANVNPEEALAAFRIFGLNWIRLTSAHERARLARTYRAVLLAGLCAVGARDYDSGTYWDHAFAAFDARSDGNRQSELAESFRYGLKTLGLSRFTLPTRRHVGEILLHGGIPIKSTGAFAKVLARWDAQNPSGDARSFVAWITSSSQHVAISRGIDVPTWLFLTETGEIAEDFVERCLVALDQLGDPGGGDTGLSPAVLDEISDEVGGTRSSPRRRDRSRRSLDSAPTISFSPQRGVEVRLPPLEAFTESDVDWLVSADGIGERIESPAPWPGDLIEPKYVGVRAPVKRVVVQVSPSDQTWDLDVVDTDDPLLVFDGESRQLIPARNTLPRGRVWVAFPNDDGSAIADRLSSDSPILVIEETAAPNGWHGWSFAALDLSAAARLSLVDATRARYVSTTRRPRLIEGDRIPHLETRDGRPVYATLPRVELPGTGSEGTLGWHVSIATIDGEVLVAREFTVAGESRIVDPWSAGPRPVLGDFVVTVRGPWGRGAVLPVAIAQGFSTEVSTSFRWMRSDGQGLEHAELRVRSGEPAASEVRVAFEPHRWRRATSLRSSTGELALTARLPSMSVSTAGAISRGKSGGPIPLDLESLRDTTLRVDVPSGTRRTQLAAVAGDRLVQALDSTQYTGESRVFSLGQLSDTLDIHRFAQLRLVVDDRSIPVAYVRPRQLATGVTVSDGTLSLDEAMPVDGLMVLAYGRFAPWEKPTRIDFATGQTSVALPEAILREGAATFVVYVANPWVPFDAPDLADWSTRNAFVAEWGDPIEPVDLPETGFRSWLAGHSPCPASDASLHIALKVYALVPRFAMRRDVDRLRSELAEAVRSSRTHVVDAVLRAKADARDLFRLFVEADVVTVPREAWESSDLLWSFSPALGIVADTDEHVGEGRDQFRANLTAYAGTPALAILDEGVDPFATVGMFGPPTRALDRMPQERIDAIMAVANLLPQGLLDKDSRAQASKQLFDQRRDRSMDAVIAVSRSLIAEARAAVTSDIGAYATTPIDVRASDDGWMSLPVLSLACAFVARAAARGGVASGRAFSKLRQAYMRLAEAAPDIVQQDLGLAELWITRWNEHDNSN